MTTSFTSIATKTLAISIATLAIGLVGPAAAKDRSQHARSAYARNVPVDAGRAREASGTPVPEPTYMAIQTQGWKDSQ